MTGHKPDDANPRGNQRGAGSAGANGSDAARSDTTRMEELLARMKQGDRVAAAEFMVENAGRIRRRFRGKLGPEVRRLFDSQDLLSTVTRRLDSIILRHKLGAGSVAELWSLVGSIAVHSIAEHTHKALNHRATSDSLETVEAPQQVMVEVKPDDAGGRVVVPRMIDECLHRLENDVDRIILLMRATGRTHTEIAEKLETNAATVRKRWQRIREVLSSMKLA